jgi:hypothetical protein
MPILIEYVTIYASWIYAVCGLAALYQIYRLWTVRAGRRQAVFSLEREKAVRELQNIFSIALLLLLVMGLTYFTSTTLAEAVAPLVEQARNPTSIVAVPPTPTNTPLAILATNTPPPVTPTATFTLTEILTLTEHVVEAIEVVAPPTATPEPPPPVAAAACADQRALIASPGSGQTLSGLVTVVGTASHEQFQYYKIEYAPAGSQNFNYLDGGNSPVINGALITFDTTAIANGSWTLRLIVVDATGNFPTPCEVTVQIAN